MTQPDIGLLFEHHIRETRAIDAAWRQIVRSTAATIALAPFVEQVMTKCPYADAASVRWELARRIEHYRPRPRRKRPKATKAEQAP